MASTTSSAVDRTALAVAPFAAMGAAIVSVQVGASFAKRLFSAIGAPEAAAMRVIFAALILAAIFRPWRSLPSLNAWPALAAYGASLGVMNLVFYEALRRIPLGLAVGLEFIGPLAVAVLASRRPLHLVWVALAAAGLAMLLPIWSPMEAVDPLGVLLALGAGVCWGLYIVFGRSVGAAHGARAAALGMAVAAVVVAPAAAASATAAMLAPPVLAAALGVALLSSVIPYTLELFALARTPVRVFGTLMSLEPAVAALMGWLILDESLTPLQLAAIAAIMAASLGVTITSRPEAQDAAPAPN